MSIEPIEAKALVTVLTEVRELLVEIREIVSKGGQVENVVDKKTREEMHREAMGKSLPKYNYEKTPVIPHNDSPF